MLTEKDLQEKIKSVGIENIRFILSVPKLHYVPFLLNIGYTNSSDKEDLVEYKIKYNKEDGWERELYNPLNEYPYKIRLEPIEDGYGIMTYYFMDFVSLIRQGTISIKEV